MWVVTSRIERARWQNSDASACRAEEVSAILTLAFILKRFIRFKMPL